MHKMAKLKFGDIFEIQTAKGLAYCQYTHHHEIDTYMIKMMTGFFEARPTDISQVISDEIRFATFYLLNIAVKRKGVTFVGNLPVRAIHQDFPTFRSPVILPGGGKVKTWWLSNATEEWKVSSLTPAQFKLPLSGLPSHPLLVEYIENEWRPENDPYFGEQAQS